MPRASRKVILTGLLMALAPGRAAAADSSDARLKQCIDDNRVAQEEMLAEHYEAAKSRASACAVDACPPMLRDHCREIADTASAKLADAAPVVAPAPPASTEAVESPTPVEPPPKPEQRQPLGSRSRVPSYVLAGVAAIGAASFGYFALSGRSKENKLDDCDRHCSDDRLDPITRDYLIADVSLGVGLLALAGSIIFWPWGTDEKAGHAALSASPNQVRLRLRF